MKGSLKNLILSLISITCLGIVVIIVLGAVDEAYAADIGTKKYITNKSEVIILVGDSRVMQMSYMDQKYRENYVLIFSNGAGIRCIDPNGGPRWIGDRFVKALKKYPNAPVVFELGVNSNSNPNTNFKRTRVYDYYIQNYPSHKFIVSSVGGTNGTGAYSNSKVISLNKKLKNKYYNKIDNVYFYDLYDYLKSSKLIEPGVSNKGTRDGLHYTNKVYRKWLKDLRKFVKFVKISNTSL